MKLAENWPDSESGLSFSMIRAQGAGGQNVNKVSSAVHLRFDIPASSLPDAVKNQLLACHDQRISKQGVVVIKAQSYRSQEQNKADALLRLRALIEEVCQPVTARRATRPSYGAKLRRLKHKTQRGQVKQLRSRRPTED